MFLKTCVIIYCLVVPSIKAGVGYRSEPRAPDGWLHTPNIPHPVVHGPGSAYTISGQRWTY